MIERADPRDGLADRASCSEGFARVVAAGDAFALIEAEPQSACKSCGHSTGCGVSALAGAFGRKPIRFSLPNDFKARAGERIVIGLSNRQLLGASALVYLLPALGLIVGAMLAGGLDDHPALVALGAALGGALGFWPARMRAAADKPVFLRRATAPIKE